MSTQFVRNGLYWNPRGGPIWKVIGDTRLVAQTTITGTYLTAEIKHSNPDFVDGLEPCSGTQEKERFEQQTRSRKLFIRMSAGRYLYA